MVRLRHRNRKNAATEKSAAKRTCFLFAVVSVFAAFQLMDGKFLQIWQESMMGTTQFKTILDAINETVAVRTTPSLSLSPPQTQTETETQTPPVVAANQSNAVKVVAKTRAERAFANDTNFWADYRMGDYVFRKGKTIGNFVLKYEGTLAVDYLHALNQTFPRFVSKTKNGDLFRPTGFREDVFCDKIKKRGESLPPDALPRDTDLVVHLRLGDVLDNFIKDEEEVEDVFEYGVSIVPSQMRDMIGGNTLGWWHYVKSKCFYENVLSKLASHAKPKRVVIVGSPVHKTGGTDNNSIKYSKLVEAFFVNKGYKVIRYLDGTPDEDMVWMSHSPVFVASGGGFSLLANICVNHFNATAFPSQGGWRNGLDKSCGEAPHPPIPKKTYSWEKNKKWRGSGGAWDPRFKNFPPEKVIWMREGLDALKKANAPSVTPPTRRIR